MSMGYAERQPRFNERQGESDPTRIRLLENDADANDRAHYFIEQTIRQNTELIHKNKSDTRQYVDDKNAALKEYVDENVKNTNLKVDRLTWAFAGACLTFSLAIIVGIVNVLTGKL